MGTSPGHLRLVEPALVATAIQQNHVRAEGSEHDEADNRCDPATGTDESAVARCQGRAVTGTSGSGCAERRRVPHPITVLQRGPSGGRSRDGGLAVRH